MYLSELKIWNYRQFGIRKSAGEELSGLHVMFNQGLNLLIGENDSGKTTIVDAIRLVLGSQSKEWFQPDEGDFHAEGTGRATYFKLECIISGFTNEQAGLFLEWLTLVETDEGTEYSLSMTYTARIVDGRIIKEIKVGGEEGTYLPSEAHELLRAVYLKPLRDAERELSPGRASRLAQILKSHPQFAKTPPDEKHELENIVAEANNLIRRYFNEGDASNIHKLINECLENFSISNSSANIEISNGSLLDVLQRLSLDYSAKKSGLGSLNLLYIAAELLLIHNNEYNGLCLTIIEELEAHLYPQVQLRLIKYLQNEDKNFGQIILTTHSVTLASSIQLENLIICKNKNVYPMGAPYTALEASNYSFLERFLDATKANLFFASGVLLVEGDSENILMPAIAQAIDTPLYAYDVSVVNVGSLAFIHYQRIFVRKSGKGMGVKVAVVTDLDARPPEIANSKGVKNTPAKYEEEKKKKLESKKEKYSGGGIQVFVSQGWTLEYELATSSLREIFLKSIYIAQHKNSHDGVEPNDGERDAIDEKVKADFKKWKNEYKNESRINSIIAADIIEEAKKVKSKPSIAQSFANTILDYREEDIKDLILESSSLEYIVRAIKYVTIGDGQ